MPRSPTLRARSSIVRLACCLVLVSSACRSPRASQLPDMYATSLRQHQKMTSVPDFQAQIQRDEKRRKTVARLIARDKLKTGQDHFYAAALLVNSEHMEQIRLAQELGLRAAELGDERGFRVAAEAIDRELLKLDQPQKYGTQYVYEPVVKKWSLYTWNETTSDAERRAMGVPPLAEALARVEILNKTKPVED